MLFNQDLDMDSTPRGDFYDGYVDLRRRVALERLDALLSGVHLDHFAAVPDQNLDRMFVGAFVLKLEELGFIRLQIGEYLESTRDRLNAMGILSPKRSVSHNPEVSFGRFDVPACTLLEDGSVKFGHLRFEDGVYVLVNHRGVHEISAATYIRP